MTNKEINTKIEKIIERNRRSNAIRKRADRIRKAPKVILRTILAISAALILMKLIAVMTSIHPAMGLFGWALALGMCVFGISTLRED